MGFELAIFEFQGRYLVRNTRILIKGSVDQVGRKQTVPAKLGEHRDQNFDSNQISQNGKKVSDSFPENSFPRSVQLPRGYFVVSVTFQEMAEEEKKEKGRRKWKTRPKTIFCFFWFLVAKENIEKNSSPVVFCFLFAQKY